MWCGDHGGDLALEPAPWILADVGRVLSIPGARPHPAAWVVLQGEVSMGRGCWGPDPVWVGKKSPSECSRVRNGPQIHEKHLPSGWFSGSVINVKSPAHTKEKGTFGYRARLF